MGNNKTADTIFRIWDFRVNHAIRSKQATDGGAERAYQDAACVQATGMSTTGYDPESKAGLASRRAGLRGKRMTWLPPTAGAGAPGGKATRHMTYDKRRRHIGYR